jgi:hypothetical protein
MRGPRTGLATLCLVAAAISGCAITSSSSPTGSSTTVTTTPPSAVGATLTLNDGTGDTIKVTLLRFQDPATPATRKDAAPAGDNLAEVLIKVTGVTGTYQDEATTAVAVVGSDGQAYSAGPETLAGCTNFKAGEFTVKAGQSLTGCVAVEIKKSVKPVQVEYDAGYVGTTGTWTT